LNHNGNCVSNRALQVSCEISDSLKRKDSQKACDLGSGSKNFLARAIFLGLDNAKRTIAKSFFNLGISLLVFQARKFNLKLNFALGIFNGSSLKHIGGFFSSKPPHQLTSQLIRSLCDKQFSPWIFPSFFLKWKKKLYLLKLVSLSW